MTREEFFKQPFSVPAGSKVALHWSDLNKTVTCYFKEYNVYTPVESVSDLIPVFVMPKKDGSCPKISHPIFLHCSLEYETLTWSLMKKLEPLGQDSYNLKWDKIEIL